ncbi:MAG: SMEK domain-containing protein [Verrucomicrobiia bacterium]
MDVPEALHKISKAVGVLTYQIRAENLAGLYSKNRLAEDLLLPIFKIVFKLPNLKNVNRDTVNFPYIDLADDGERVAMQVSSETSASKITETLKGFIAKGYHARYDRLLIFLLTTLKSNYQARTKKQWSRLCRNRVRFNPDSDIINTQELYRLIQGIPHADILAVHDIIASSIIGEEYVDVETSLAQQATQQVEYEKNSTKYIPDIFIETPGTKHLARIFCHPALFFNGILDELRRTRLPFINDRLRSVGFQQLIMPNLTQYSSKRTLPDVAAFAAKLSADLTAFSQIALSYKELSGKKPPPFSVPKDRQYLYDQLWYKIQDGAWSLQHTLEDIRRELAVVNARVFILTGRAGQGKTNLVCDLVENFLMKHRIPSAFLSGRRLSQMQGVDLAASINYILFGNRTRSFSDGATLLSRNAGRANKPFVLIIDGLNEHHKLGEFSQQLESFIETALQFPNIKIFLTCRSEFFHDRFDNLTRSSFANELFLHEPIENRYDEMRNDRLITGYFKFFRIDEHLVSHQAIEVLSRDVLLLRFFCEAYGARGKSKGYKQPHIAHIYRDQVFRLYLDNKLGTADAFLRRVTGKPYVSQPKTELLNVIQQIVEYMLRNWHFTDVPVSAIPADLHVPLYSLLDEDVILRRDVTPAGAVFPASQETINFTFDEFRDFLIAQYMLDRVYVTDKNAFSDYISRNDPKQSQITEGIRKFLFYASRRPANKEFLTFYKEQQWYKEIYIPEVFYIEDNLTNGDDRETILGILEAGGPLASKVAWHLVLRWESPFYSILNLNLLLSFLENASDQQHDALIAVNFAKSHPNKQLDYSTARYAEVIRDLTTRCTLSSQSPQIPLLRLLILLFPLDTGLDLESPSVDVFRQLLAVAPELGIGLLRDSFKYKFTVHKPQVWRLLSESSSLLSASDPLVSLAKSELKRIGSAASAPVLHKEISRFLAHMASRPVSSPEASS